MFKKYQSPFCEMESLLDCCESEEIRKRVEFVKGRRSSFDGCPTYAIDVYTTLA
jgi:hypothetical protein